MNRIPGTYRTPHGRRPVRAQVPVARRAPDRRLPGRRVPGCWGARIGATCGFPDVTADADSRSEPARQIKPRATLVTGPGQAGPARTRARQSYQAG
jgi:hypothetical protein